MELMKLMEDWKGFVALNESSRPEGYELKLNEVMSILTNEGRLAPHRHEYLFKEVMTTSDFPLLFGDVIDRLVLASYKATVPVWRPLVKVSTLRDFKTAYRFAITGGDQYLAEVAEKGEYLASTREEERYSISLKKYGRQFDISWETLINDDLGALRDTPERFARAAMRTEHRIVTGLYAGDIGTHTANANLYEAGVNCVATALTIASLEEGIRAMVEMLDDASEPILNRPKYLVVVPALELTARAILTSATKMWLTDADVGLAAPTAYPLPNVVSQMGLTLIVDPYLPVLDPESDDEAWYLFADPNDIATMEVAYLSGHERPEICMKASDKVSVGGGDISPMEGDFVSDNILYRVRLVFGGCTLDWRGTYMGGCQEL